MAEGEKIIGIDLGTTYSAVAVMEGTQKVRIRDNRRHTSDKTQVTAATRCASVSPLLSCTCETASKDSCRLVP